MTGFPQTHKFPFITTGTKTVLFVLKNRIKAPRVVPAPSTGDPAVDDATRREFERVKEQLNADYQDQRALINDLEPLLFELAEQIQGWMMARDEQMMNLILAARGGVGPAFNNPAIAALPGTGAVQDFGGVQNGAPYEGQLIRGDGTTNVYKVEGGRKRGIVSQQAFERLGFKWENVRVLPLSIVDSIPMGANIT